MGLRTHDEPIPEGERVFMQASDRKAMEDGDVPVKIRNFSERSSDG